MHFFIRSCINNSLSAQLPVVRKLVVKFHPQISQAKPVPLSANFVKKSWVQNKIWGVRPTNVILGALSESCPLSVGIINAPIVVRPPAKRTKCKGHNYRQFRKLLCFTSPYPPHFSLYTIFPLLLSISLLLPSTLYLPPLPLSAPIFLNSHFQ